MQLLRLALVVWTAFAAFFPLRYGFPGASPDDSWIVVLGEARQRGWAFGRDIVFTGGPLSSLYTGYVADGDLLLLACVRMLLAVALARFIWLLLKDAPIALFLAALLLLSGDAYVPALGDPLLLAIPLLVVMALLVDERRRVDGPTLALGIAAAALVSLVKFSSAVMALPAFVLLDLRQLSRRRVPLFAISYIAATFAIFLALGGTPSDFAGFVYYSLAMSAGYSDAMGSYLESSTNLRIFMCLAALWIIFVGITGFGLRRSHHQPPSSLLGLLLMLWFLFLVSKAGFLRDDLSHEPTAWAGLGLLGILETAVWLRYSDRADRPVLAWALAASVVALPLAAAGAASVAGMPERHEHGVAGIIDALGSRLAGRFQETARFVTGPARWLEAKQQERIAAWQEIRTHIPVPHVEDSVDTISSKQAALIAAGLRYQPHPTVQEYAAFNERLIAADRRALIPASGPDILLVAPEWADYRLPSLAEGPLWPEFLRVFTPVRLEDGLVVMQRREAPLPDLLGPAAIAQARLDDTISLDDKAPGAVFLSVSLRKTLLGSILSLLLKPNPIMIEVETSTGRHVTHRLIPAIAEAGFVISPYVATAEDFLALAQGLPAGPASPETVKSFRLYEERWWSRFGIDWALYRSDFPYTRRDIAMAALRSTAANSD